MYYGYIHIYIYSLSTCISADLFQSSSVLDYICKPPIPSSPADPDPPLLQYLAISLPAVCNLAKLQNTPCLIASS